MGEKLSRDKLCTGVWDNDIDKYPDDKYTLHINGYKCKIKRNYTWTYCGYVYLPPNHPDYSKTYETLENEMIVHGDLTYGDGSGVFGFDCHHILSGDMSPADETMKLSDSKFNDLFSSPIDNPHYWTFDEVKEELTRLVQQFKARDIN